MWSWGAAHSCVPQPTPVWISQNTEQRKLLKQPTHRETAKAGEEQMGISFPSPPPSPLLVAAGGRAETYFVFQQVIKGFMVWWVWSIVRASRSQWRAHSWRKRGSLPRQRRSTVGSHQNNALHNCAGSQLEMSCSCMWTPHASIH